MAEVIAGELARALGLPIPEQVIVEIDPALGAAEPDPEIQELIVASAGQNLGIDFLPGRRGVLARARAGRRTRGWRPRSCGSTRCSTNVDRTPQNPNLLLWHERLWLIDHGAALYLQHAGLRPAEHAGRPFPQIAEHVLLPCAGSIVAADARLAPQIDRALLETIVALVPADWFAGEHPETYVEYLARRLEAPRGFVEEAERARTGA